MGHEAIALLCAHASKPLSLLCTSEAKLRPESPKFPDRFVELLGAELEEVFYEGQFDPSSFFNIDFLAMVYMLVFVVMSFPASYVIDTHGIRVGVSLGALLAGAAGLSKGMFADSFTAVVVAQVGLAVAQPFILNAVTAMSVRWFPHGERGMAAGFSALAQHIGIFIAMLVTPMLVGSDPVKAGYGSGFEGMLLWVGQITGMIFVAGMSVESNRYLPTFMISFAVLSLFCLAAVLLLRESPMIITERDRMEA